MPWPTSLADRTVTGAWTIQRQRGGLPSERGNPMFIGVGTIVVIVIIVLIILLLRRR